MLVEVADIALRFNFAASNVELHWLFCHVLHSELEPVVSAVLVKTRKLLAIYHLSALSIPS